MRWPIVLLLAFAILTVACNRPQPGPDRLAILPLENLTGDASLEWVGPAAGAILREELAGSTKIIVLAAASPSEAYQLTATRFLHTTLSIRPAGGAHSVNSVRIQYQFEEAQSHKLTDPQTLDGGAFAAVRRLASALDPAARPFSSENAQAIEAWGHGDFERAVQLDPGFGTAWGAWAQNLVNAGKKTEALAVAEQALQQSSLRGNIQRTQVELLAASLGQDSAKRSAALLSLSQLLPNDVAVMTEMMSGELRARRYAEAVKWLRRALAVQPNDANLLNSLGYAEGMAGNLEGAKAALVEYGKEPGQETNALDSLGEVHFLNGKFVDAARYFHQCYTKDPQFLSGSALAKAAYAEWLAGNLASADATLRPYFSAIRDRDIPTAAWSEATWLYSTGRTDQAAAILRQNPSPIAQRQLDVWSGKIAPPTDLRALETAYRNATPLNDGMERTFFAEALSAAGRADEARRLLERWPLPQEGEPLFQSLVFGKFAALRKALGLS